LTLKKDKFELYDWNNYAFNGGYSGNIVHTHIFTGSFTNDGNIYKFSVEKLHSERSSAFSGNI